MSTYTDLHNTVKESLNVDYTTRVTTQEASLLNERNRYWGTFEGNLAVKSSVIVDSVVANSMLSNVQLCGNVILPGGIDLGIFGPNIAQMSADIGQNAENLTTEETARIDNDRFLSSRISSVASISELSTTESRLSNRISDLSCEHNRLSTEIDVLSSKLSTEIDMSVRLSNEIDVLSVSLSTLEQRHYNTTFISTDRADHPAHISSDNLILTDTLARNLNDDIHNRYHLTFKYGTMVLVKDN